MVANGEIFIFSRLKKQVDTNRTILLTFSLFAQIKKARNRNKKAHKIKSFLNLNNIPNDKFSFPTF